MTLIAEGKAEDLMVRDHFRAHEAADGLALMAGDGRVEAGETRISGGVPLPAEPDEGEALFEQEAVAKMRGLAGVEGERGSAMEQEEHELVAAVGDVDRTVPLPRAGSRGFRT